MRILAVLLLILGVVALVIPSITFFTQERVADVGFFHIDVAKPHTIFLNPAAGIAALVVGVVLLLASGRRGAAA
jgi:hypothetical protein